MKVQRLGNGQLAVYVPRALGEAFDLQRGDEAVWSSSAEQRDANELAILELTFTPGPSHDAERGMSEALDVKMRDERRVKAEAEVAE